MSENYTVYMHTTPSGKRYVGITCKSTRRRWNCGKGYSHNVYFTRAINKYGWEAIAHEVLLDGLSETEAIDRERFYIALFRTSVPKFGYNRTLGGEVGKEYTEEARRKMSDAQRGEKSHAFGKTFDAGHRAKISEALRGRSFSEEHRRKLSEAASEREHKPFTAEHCERIASALRGKPKSAEHNRKNGEVHSRPVINLETGERFPNIRCAAREYGVSPTAINRCLLGKSKSSCGYHWAYAEKHIKSPKNTQKYDQTVLTK